MSTHVICIATSKAEASVIVTNLQRAGFSGNDISALFPDQGGTKDFAHERHAKGPERATTDVGAGWASGAVPGLLTGVGTLAIPGVGPLIAAGPIMANPERGRGRCGGRRHCGGPHRHRNSRDRSETVRGKACRGEHPHFHQCRVF